MCKQYTMSLYFPGTLIGLISNFTFHSMSSLCHPLILANGCSVPILGTICKIVSNIPSTYLLSNKKILLKTGADSRGLIHYFASRCWVMLWNWWPYSPSQQYHID